MEETIQQYRAFIALDIPPMVKRQLLTHVLALQEQQSLRGLRWIPESNWHLTLAFLGDQTESLLLELWASLVSVTEPLLPVPVSLKSISGFPDAKSPVLAALVELSDSLEMLQAEVQQTCGSLGISLDRRRFKPHITLARVRRRQPVRYQGEPLNLAARWGSMTLYISELTPDGSIYTPLRQLRCGSK